MSGTAARPAAGRRPRFSVLFEARWGRSLRALSLVLWGASLAGAALLVASLAEWWPTGDDSRTLIAGQGLLLLAAAIADGRRRRHVMRVLRPRDGRGIVIETLGLFGPVHRFVPLEQMARIKLGAPDIHGVMTLRLPGQRRPYRLDTAGREIDLGLDAIPRGVSR
ncbi:MAG: hypothetical protein N3D18_00770 [Roseococcus sp.]|nr:hypothetical protein [Roseococcus sp.]